MLKFPDIGIVTDHGGGAGVQMLCSFWLRGVVLIVWNGP